MENYIVSARKYRPATFHSVIGQKALTTTLKNAIATGKLAQAYLFCGPRGVGKTTCARIFAKTINCMNPTAEGEACNACESCQAFNEQRSYNIHELDAASNNSVDDIRTLVDQVRVPPQIGQYKVYIIDEVHMLSTSAFNAFLKTLEEPPRHALFILATTEKQKILPTILSRCQIYDFSRITVEDIVEHLADVAGKEHISAETEALNVIARKADGGMRDALSIFDQVASFCQGNITYQSVIENLNVLDYEYYFKMTDLLLQGQVPQSLLLFDEVLGKGFDAGNFLAGLGSHLRDLLVSKDAITVNLLEVGGGTREQYRLQAGRCPLEFLYPAMKICCESGLNYRNSRNKRFLVECALIQLAQLMQGSVPAPPSAAGIQPIQTDQATGTTMARPMPQPAPAVAPPTASAQPPTAAPPPAAAPPAPSTLLTPKEKPATQPLPKTGIGSLGISIKRNKPTVAAPQTNHASATAPKADNPFNAEDVARCWEAYAEQLPQERVALARRMRTITPQLLDESVVEVAVENEILAHDLQAIIPDMSQFMQRRLQNSRIQVRVKVTKVEMPDTALSRADQFKKMSEKNGALLHLKRELSLELH